jgi:hypothetical protein
VVCECLCVWRVCDCVSRIFFKGVVMIYGVWFVVTVWLEMVWLEKVWFMRRAGVEAFGLCSEHSHKGNLSLFSHVIRFQACCGA